MVLCLEVKGGSVESRGGSWYGVRGGERERIKDHLVRFPGMDEGDDFVVLRVVEIRQADGTWWRYVTNVMDSGFTFKNPNATGSCGCGSSFTA